MGAGTTAVIDCYKYRRRRRSAPTWAPVVVAFVRDRRREWLAAGGEDREAALPHLWTGARYLILTRCAPAHRSVSAYAKRERSGAELKIGGRGRALARTLGRSRHVHVGGRCGVARSGVPAGTVDCGVPARPRLRLHAVRSPDEIVKRRWHISCFDMPRGVDVDFWLTDLERRRACSWGTSIESRASRDVLRAAR
jgi:hypothetical protein